MSFKIEQLLVFSTTVNPTPVDSSLFEANKPRDKNTYLQEESKVIKMFYHTLLENQKTFKIATKLYFMHSPGLFITLFKTDSYKFAFSTYSFIKLVFRLSLL